MNKFMKLAPIGIIVAALVLMIFLGRNFIDSLIPALSSTYYKDFKSEAELEYKYSQLGPYDVSDRTIETEDEDLGNLRCWYPEGESGEKYPMIIVVNPSMLPSANYKPFFERLASWGFVVIGNDDGSAGTGASTSATLDAMMGLVDTHPVREFTDYDNIGIVGYSQGGSGALAAVSEYENGSAYKTIFTGSAACHDVADEYGWKYDTSKVAVPYFMAAGTGDTDSGNEEEDIVGAAPLYSLIDAYDSIDESVPKVRARFVGAEHNEMLKKCDGYMTAWMLYQLKGDTEAAGAFEGDNAEILTNANWQDIEKNQ